MIYSKRENIKDAQFDEEDKKLIREAMATIDPGIDLVAVLFSKNPDLETKGWDIVARKNGEVFGGIQVKFRRKKWWPKRGIDFAIEEYDGNRPGGLGWFKLYAKQGIVYMAFLWKNDDERFLQVYHNNDDTWFRSVAHMREHRNYYPWEVDEKGMDGIVRKVGGFILPLKHIAELLVYPTTSKADQEGLWDFEGLPF